MTPQVRCFPVDDSDFAAAVSRAFHAIDDVTGHGLQAADAAEELELALRATYPHARVSPMSPLADVGSGPPVWYVYRDGGLLKGTAHEAS